MKKTLLTACILGALVASAEDSYLYWMVGETTPYHVSYSYATVKVEASDPSNYLNIYDDTGLIGTRVEAGVIDTYESGEGFFASLATLTDPTAASFVVELWSDSDEVVARSSPLAYNSSYITHGGIGAPASTLWLAPMQAVPEPNSAMLMLVGIAALGLRRRRQKKA